MPSEHDATPSLPATVTAGWSCRTPGSTALVRRFRAAGGQLRCGSTLDSVLVEDDRAVGVTVGGERIRSRRGVLADVVAPRLYEDLLPDAAVPADVRDDRRRYQRGALVFPPRVGLGRPETPKPGLYLASASAHPGGGVHGACGANAAHAALAHDRIRRLTHRRSGRTRG